MSTIIIDKMKLKNLSILNKTRNYNLGEKYFGDDQGNVYKVTNEKDTYTQISPYVNRDGYVEYVLTNLDSKKKHIMGHIICATLWIPNPLKKPEVNHNDGNRSNNKKSNLTWSTHAENVQHSYDELRGKK